MPQLIFHFANGSLLYLEQSQVNFNDIFTNAISDISIEHIFTTTGSHPILSRFMGFHN